MFNCPSKNTAEQRHIHTKTSEHLLLARIKIQFSNLETSYQLLNLTIAWLSVPIIWLFFVSFIEDLILVRRNNIQSIDERNSIWLKKKEFRFFFLFLKKENEPDAINMAISTERVYEKCIWFNIIHITSSDSESHCR